MAKETGINSALAQCQQPLSPWSILDFEIGQPRDTITTLGPADRLTDLLQKTTLSQSLKEKKILVEDPLDLEAAVKRDLETAEQMEKQRLTKEQQLRENLRGLFPVKWQLKEIVDLQHMYESGKDFAFAVLDGSPACTIIKVYNALDNKYILQRLAQPAIRSESVFVAIMACPHKSWSNLCEKLRGLPPSLKIHTGLGCIPSTQAEFGNICKQLADSLHVDWGQESLINVRRSVEIVLSDERAKRVLVSEAFTDHQSSAPMPVLFSCLRLENRVYLMDAQRSVFRILESMTEGSLMQLMVRCRGTIVETKFRRESAFTVCGRHMKVLGLIPVLTMEEMDQINQWTPHPNFAIKQVDMFESPLSH